MNRICLYPAEILCLFVSVCMPSIDYSVYSLLIILMTLGLFKMRPDITVMVDWT